jgi:hypothetical protein
MKKNVFLLAALCAMGVVAAQAAGSTTSTGWISDSMCGAKHMGSGMKPVFVDPDKQVWAIDNPDAVKAFYGAKVTVTGSEDSGNKTIHIESIVAAK